MKRIVTLLLALCLSSMIILPASAANVCAQHDWTDWMLEYDQKGYTLEWWDDCYFIYHHLWRYCTACDVIEQTIDVDYYPHIWYDGVHYTGYPCTYCATCGIIGTISVK